MRVRFASGVLTVAAALSIGVAGASAQGGSAGDSVRAQSQKQVLTVCKHGCRYRTIQKAVDASGENAVIKVKPGKYVEGVLVSGHKHDGLAILGTGKTRRAVILEGKNAKGDDGGPAQNGVEGANVDNLRLENMWARNYLANGFFVHTDSIGKKTECHGYLMKNLLASFNRSYGMYAFECIGGRITRSAGFGHGDSAFYIGGTPFPQKKPKWTSLDHLQGYENILGYSGTNSHYVNIHDSQFFNNGVGVVPNTLDSEPYEPTGNGIMENNQIFWNNFNYFLPTSRVRTVSGGLGDANGSDPGGTIQYPTGVGVVLLGADGWKVRNNDIFGNFKWGVAPISNPLNDGDDAISLNNQMVGNRMGRNGADANGVDFFSDGSGKGNCYSGNGASATFDPGSTPTDQLYPKTCPTTIGPGTSIGDSQQFGELLNYVTTDPPEKQECSWTKHPHPKYKGFKPLSVKGATCP